MSLLNHRRPLMAMQCLRWLVPAIVGFSGSCADDSQVEINFTARTNGGIRFQIYADATSGEQIDTPSNGIDYWNIPNCSWAGSSDTLDEGANKVYTNEYMVDQVFIACQASVAEQTGSQSFCLTPGIPYRVRFDGVQPFLPGPMELGFKLAGMDSSAPIPANWISTCALDGTTENCDLMSATLSGPPAHAGRPDAPWRPAHAGRPGNPGGGGRPGLDAPLLTAEDGTAGAASCTAAGSKVSCTWTANGTWELPSLYTDPGGWITIQAVGGSGGFGIPASNSGGTAGRAQVVLSAESLAGKTLYAYVGENGVDTPDGTLTSGGGAASLVTTSEIPASFVSNGCIGTAADIDARVIAGGGGGGSVSSGQTTYASGGTGGIAVGGSGIQQTIGSGSPGGQATYAFGGQPPVYGGNPFDGNTTVSGGYSARWPYNVPAEVDYSGNAPIALGGGQFSTHTASWLANNTYLTLDPPSGPGVVCGGGLTNWGGGGGGGSEGQMSSVGLWAAAGGGGSSWASGAGVGVTLPSALSDWQTLTNSEPSQVVITVDCSGCAFVADCAMEDTSLRPVMRCILPKSTLPLALDILGEVVAMEIGQDVSDEVPVYLEAWGGHGGNGGKANNGCKQGLGGTGGAPGYARSSHTFGALNDLTSDLWLYVGAKGGNGPSNSATGGCPTAYAPPGAGGASTLVLQTQLMSSVALNDVLLSAAGGGGGGQGSARSTLAGGSNGNPGKAGGSAIANTTSAANAGGGGYGGGMVGGAGGSYAAQASLDDSGAPVLGPGNSPSSTNGVVVISFDVCSTSPTLEVCQP